MSSEVHKYIEKALDKNENLFNAEVISFPNDKKTQEFKYKKINTYNSWKISDKSNADQFKAIIGICFMFAALVVMGLYSSLT